jgi:hypothetical protein
METFFTFHILTSFILPEGEAPITPSLETIEDNTNSTKTNGTIIQDEEEMSTTPLSAVDLLKLRQEKIEAKKIMISELVSSVLEDPQANVS